MIAAALLLASAQYTMIEVSPGFWVDRTTVRSVDSDLTVWVSHRIGGGGVRYKVLVSCRSGSVQVLREQTYAGGTIVATRNDVRARVHNERWGRAVRRYVCSLDSRLPAGADP